MCKPQSTPQANLHFNYLALVLCSTSSPTSPLLLIIELRCQKVSVSLCYLFSFNFCRIYISLDIHIVWYPKNFEILSFLSEVELGKVLLHLVWSISHMPYATKYDVQLVFWPYRLSSKSDSFAFPSYEDCWNLLFT